MKNKKRTSKERIGIETKNGNGIAFCGPCRRWWLRRILHTSHVQKVSEEKDHGLPERLAVAEMIVSGILVQKNMKKKPSQTVMALLMACRCAA